ncbi:macro domain-containing protein [bacterium]|nr:macro domain-containing protein [bacterium]
MHVNGTTIRVEQGDMTLTEIEAIAFYATEDLKLGTGFGNAISMRGGPPVQEELNNLAPLLPLQAVVSSAGDLPAEYIIHANGPKFQETDMAGKLKTTLVNTLAAAVEKGITRIAYPPMGAGFYGVPIQECAKVMVNTFIEHAQRGSSIKEIVIVTMNKREYQPFAQLLHEDTKEVAA